MCCVAVALQIKKAFTQIAADLAGVELTKTDLTAHSEVIPALIIDHKQHDEKVNEGKVPDYVGSSWTGGAASGPSCVVS